MAGLWNSDMSQNSRPGLYVRFVDAAKAVVANADKAGVVALTLETYGTAPAKKVSEFTSLDDAKALYGDANVGPIDLAFQGGCEKVVVYTVETIDGTTVTEKIAYDNARFALDVYDFDVFVYGDQVGSAEQDDALKWVQKSRDEGRHFTIVFGAVADADDDDITIGNARSVRLADEYAVNIVSGGMLAGVYFSSNKVAQFVAGLVAKTPLNQSITFAVTPFDDVKTRLTVTQVKDALAAGSLPLVNNGEVVRLERGIVTRSTDDDGNAKVYKLRRTRVHQVVSNELGKLIENEVIGKINANDDGYAFAVSMVKLYLEQLEANEVLTDITVKLSSDFESTGDQLFIDCNFVELDSVERVFLTIVS
jgi:hypothetical protein